MIGKLKGLIDEIGDDYCVVDVGGVGYVAYCSSRTLGNLPGPGEATVVAMPVRCTRRISSERR